MSDCIEEVEEGSYSMCFRNRHVGHLLVATDRNMDG